METVVANEKIDTIAVACAPADLVPLFSKLREYGVSIMSLDNLDKESSFFVDDVILGECDEDDEDDSIEELAAGFAEKPRARINLPQRRNRKFPQRTKIPRKKKTRKLPKKRTRTRISRTTKPSSRE